MTKQKQEMCEMLYTTDPPKLIEYYLIQQDNLDEALRKLRTTLSKIKQ